MDQNIERARELSTKNQEEQLAQHLSDQEKLRMLYWTKYDHFIDIRLKWQASTMRHLLHVLPGQKILEIGAGDGRFTETLNQMTRGECSITAVVFSPGYKEAMGARLTQPNIQIHLADNFPGTLQEKKFDFIVAHHMLGDKSRNAFLQSVKNFLKPGGGVLFFEPNPWNPYFRLRHFVQSILPLKWPRPAEPISFNRLQVYTVLSEIGFARIHALPYDFLYAPIPRWFQGLAQHVSLIMENCPFIRNFAGSLYIWAYKSDPLDYRAAVVDLAEHEMFRGKVSFVIPCHNEEMNIVPLVEQLKGFFEKYIFEIIIIDDNSSDRTAEVAENLSREDGRIKVIRRTPPNGVGRALRDGLSAAEGEYILIMDCDFQDIVPEMRDLFAAMAEGADVVVGSRFSRESVLLNYPFTKIIANRMFHALANLFLRTNVRDISNNLKILKKNVAKSIHIESHDFAANAETGLKPILKGYKVTEVPISWMNRSMAMGLSSFQIIKTGPNYGRLLWKLILRRTKGKTACC